MCIYSIFHYLPVLLFVHSITLITDSVVGGGLIHSIESRNIGGRGIENVTSTVRYSESL